MLSTIVFSLLLLLLIFGIQRKCEHECTLILYLRVGWLKCNRILQIQAYYLETLPEKLADFLSSNKTVS